MSLVLEPDLDELFEGASRRALSGTVLFLADDEPLELCPEDLDELLLPLEVEVELGLEDDSVFLTLLRFMLVLLTALVVVRDADLDELVYELLDELFVFLPPVR